MVNLAFTISASAVPTTLVPNTSNMFRDTRGINKGDDFHFGANIQGEATGSTLGVYPPDGLTNPQVVCARLTVSPNFCANTPFNICMRGFLSGGDGQ